MAVSHITETEVSDFFERTPDLVCIAQKNGFFKKVNPAVIQKLEYSIEELLSTPIASFIHPEDKELTGKRREKLLTGESLLNFENRYIAKSGKVIWLSWTSIYIPDKEVVFAIAKDITEKKQAEKAVEENYYKYKNLASHFKSSMEEDRRYFAFELHEEVAQLAAAINMDLDWAKANVPELSEFSKQRIEHAASVTNLLIRKLQRLSFSISPAMLDEFGLNMTINWHCKEFELLNNIRCTFEAGYEESDLSLETKIDFFRICQEALENVLYHAEADAVTIGIEEKGGKIKLMISDNGKGFDTALVKTGVGLVSMKERAASINSIFEVESAEGKGTTISVTIKKQQ